MNPPPQQNARPSHYVLIGLLIVAIVISYFGIWNGYYNTEDDFNWNGQMRHKDTLVEAAQGLENGVRFLNYAMLWIKTRLFDTNAALYFWAGLVQHAVVASILYGLLIFWTQNRVFAFLAALLFATKSAYWEILTSTSATDYSFWAIFYLLVFALFAVYLRRRTRWLYPGSIALYAILAFGHDFTLSMPLILLAYHLTLGRGERPLRSFGLSDLKFHFPYWIIWGIHLSIQLYYIFIGTSEAIYSTATYGPGLHMVSNLRWLSTLILPNIPIWNRLTLMIGPQLTDVLTVAINGLALLIHGVALYFLWKGPNLARFAVGLIYLPFLQYLPWGETFANAPRYLYFPSMGFAILLALLIMRLYTYLVQKNNAHARTIAGGVMALILIFNVATIQLWVQRNVTDSGLRRNFVESLQAQVPTGSTEMTIYMEVPEDKFEDLDFACVLLYRDKPTCRTFVTGEDPPFDPDQVAPDAPPIYWFRASREGAIQVFPE